MKLTDFTKLLVLGLILTGVASGCHKRPGRITELPGHVGNNVPDDKNAPPLVDNAGPKSSDGGFGQVGPGQYDKYNKDSEMFKSETVHFDFDSSVVKAGEKSKLSKVADYLKANQMDALEVDGHCDERGTEEYNRSLGERRALALREQLINLGIDQSHVITVSFGKDRPADPGHDDAAWKQNRRGEFVLLTPPK